MPWYFAPLLRLGLYAAAAAIDLLFMDLGTVASDPGVIGSSTTASSSADPLRLIANPGGGPFGDSGEGGSTCCCPAGPAWSGRGYLDPPIDRVREMARERFIASSAVMGGSAKELMLQRRTEGV